MDLVSIDAGWLLHLIRHRASRFIPVFEGDGNIIGILAAGTCSAAARLS
jgi:hypothetical protein